MSQMPYRLCDGFDGYSDEYIDEGVRSQMPYRLCDAFDLKLGYNSLDEVPESQMPYRLCDALDQSERRADADGPQVTNAVSALRCFRLSLLYEERERFHVTNAVSALRCF